MKSELLKEYAELKIQEKRIKARVEEIAPVIKQDILGAGLDKLPTTMGNFNIKKLKRWTYTDQVLQAEESLKKLRAFEEATGAATFSEVEILEFRELKNE